MNNNDPKQVTLGAIAFEFQYIGNSGRTSGYISTDFSDAKMLIHVDDKPEDIYDRMDERMRDGIWMFSIEGVPVYLLESDRQNYQKTHNEYIERKAAALSGARYTD